MRLNKASTSSGSDGLTVLGNGDGSAVGMKGEGVGGTRGEDTWGDCMVNRAGR